jgi:hypothetical protein
MMEYFKALAILIMMELILIQIIVIVLRIVNAIFKKILIFRHFLGKLVMDMISLLKIFLYHKV